MSFDADCDTERLLDLAANGDEAAVSQLMLRHRDRLRQMISVRMDNRLARRVDPSDVVQEAMMEATRKLPEYLKNRPIPFYPWLRQMAWNRLVDLYRKHVQGAKRSVDREAVVPVELSDDSVTALAARLAASQTSPSGHLLQKELQERVRVAVSQLPDHYREVLVMRHLEQLSIREIAVIEDIAEGTVKSRLFRGMELLHDLLDDQSFGAT